MLLQILFSSTDSITNKAPQYCLFFPPFTLIFLCLCQSCVITCVFLFHLGFNPFELLFHTNVFQRRFITAVSLVMPFISVTRQRNTTHLLLS